MKVAATYTFVVDVDDQPLDAGGRPPKKLANWDPRVLEAIGNAVEEHVHSVKDPFNGDAIVEVEILEHAGWEG